MKGNAVATVTGAYPNKLVNTMIITAKQEHSFII